MPLEVEAKLKVSDHEGVRRELRIAGATLTGEVLEINRIFDSADGSLRAGGRGLRVRICRERGGRILRTILTYKGPQLPSNLKAREEIQVEVADPTAMTSLLAALGFVEILRFEKHRESWHLRDCSIELDELPHLGRFVEIEGPDEQSIHHIQTTLGLGNLPHIPDTYIAMLVRHCRKHGLPLHVEF